MQNLSQNVNHGFKSLARLLVLFCLIGIGCSSEEKTAKAKLHHDLKPEIVTNSRYFNFHRQVVKSLLTDDRIGYRKIERQTPLIYKDSYIVGNSHDGIQRIDSKSGETIWNFSVKGGVETSAVLFGELIFFGGLDGQFYSLKAETGRLEWSFPTRLENIADPLVHDGTVYFMAGNNLVYALHAKTGQQKWLYARPETLPLSIRGGGRPLVANGILYAGFSDGYLVALSAQEGTLKWETSLSKNKRFRDLDGEILLSGEYLYILGYDSQLSIVKRSNGELAWRHTRGGFGGVLATDKLLIFATSDSEVVALSRDTNEKVWSYAVTDGIGTSPQLWNNKYVVFGESRGALIFLDLKNGRPIAGFEPGRGIFGKPRLREDRSEIAFVSGEGNLYILKVNELGTRL